MNDAFQPAQVVPAQQPMGGMMPSSLAAALMGRGGMPSMQNPMGQIPLASLAMLMQQQQQQQQPGGSGPGPASPASAAQAWGGNPQIGGGGASDVPGPPSAFRSMLPSWLGGPSASNY